jgi:hypothetical protein
MADKYEAAEIYIGLRDRALSPDAKQLNVAGPVLSVLMETGYPQAVATLVAVADGATSLYFSDGGGMIGAGEYPQVREVALELIKFSGGSLNILEKTDKYPLPKKEFTRFYVVTSAGVYTAEVLEKDLGEERHALSSLFFQGHKLISYIRAAEEHRVKQGVSDVTK